MEILNIYPNPERSEWAALTERCTRREEEITRQVASILDEVRTGGDRALRDITRRIEGRDCETFEVSADVRRTAAALIPEALKEALDTAKANIEAFHRAQLPPEVSVEPMPGVRCVQRALPIRRVGLYIPGGKAPLFSTVLMLAVPARVAGCPEVVLCTPARPDGTIAPEILYAADLCGVDRVYAVGGAQAVAALAYGTESIPRVDKIFGPGNRYVTKAKQLVGANDVAVDLPAGPSEVLVLADDEASPDFAAADLLSQAEHGGDSQAVLVCASERFARDTRRAVEEQLQQLQRGDTIREALRQSRIVVLDSREKMIAFANAYAPEHLIVSMRDAWEAAAQITAAGSVARERRRLRLGHQPHAAHGRLGAGLQRRQHRFVPAQDHLSGTHPRRAFGPLPGDRRYGRGRRARGARRRSPRPSEKRAPMKTLEQLVRPNIRALKPYSTARDEYAGGEITTWLDANENPYENGVNRYPDPHQKELKQRIAALKGVREEQVFIGNGSDEAIDLAYRIFCRPGTDNAVSIAPTYGMYRVAADINDIEMREVPLGEEFSLPVEALLAAADERTKLLWLCSPNNPTGNAFPAADIERLIRRFDGMVVLDEAYIDFASGPGFLARLDEFENLIVLQTLSKAWGMAGLRLGLAFASAPVAELFARVKYPYNINCLAQAAVAERLSFDIAGQVAQLRAERDAIARALAACPAIERVYPSEANFVLVRTPDPDRLYDALIAAGVIVRNRSRIPGCEGCLRITVGTPEENVRMLETVKNFTL